MSLVLGHNSTRSVCSSNADSEFRSRLVINEPGKSKSERVVAARRATRRLQPGGQLGSRLGEVAHAEVVIRGQRRYERAEKPSERIVRQP